MNNKWYGLFLVSIECDSKRQSQCLTRPKDGVFTLDRSECVSSSFPQLSSYNNSHPFSPQDIFF